MLFQYKKKGISHRINIHLLFKAFRKLTKTIIYSKRINGV
jgi:hypothetical protein